MRLGVLQCDLVGNEEMVQEQASKLKAELMELDKLCSQGRRVLLFQSWNDEWNSSTIEDTWASKKNALDTFVSALVSVVLKIDMFSNDVISKFAIGRPECPFRKRVP